MSLPGSGWKNKNGTSDRDCKCGTWKQHWINFSKKDWPSSCRVSDCNSAATLGAHIYHADVAGERISPMCNSCNGLSGSFSLKGSTNLPSASTSETCD